MGNSKYLKNSLFSVMQTVITAISALVIFKLSASEVGLSVTGLWSYLASIIAITGFGSFGFANALLFYLPQYTTLKQYDRISDLVNTTFLSTFVLTAILCIVAYFIFYFTIPATVEAGLVPIANKILPLVLLSLFFLGLSSTYFSVLDGMMLMHLRAKIYIAGSLVFLFFGFFLIKKIGIIGIPIAQAAQSVTLLIAGFIAVKKHQPHYQFSLRPNKKIFSEIFKYGFNFQLISVTQILADPFIKTMVTKFAGPANTAIFDITMKILAAIRGLLISANQIVVPQVTVFNTLKNSSRLITFYKTNFKLIFLLGIIFFLTPLAFSDLFVDILFQKQVFNGTFILYNVALALFINALAFPAHFQYLGIGKLKWLVINNSVTALLMLISAPLIGYFAEGIYVVMAWSVPTIVGPIILINALNKEYNISTFKMIDRSSIFLLCAFALVILLNYNVSRWSTLENKPIQKILLQVAIYIAILFYPVLSNITFKKIVTRIKYRYGQ